MVQPSSKQSSYSIRAFVVGDVGCRRRRRRWVLARADTDTGGGKWVGARTRRCTLSDCGSVATRDKRRGGLDWTGLDWLARLSYFSAEQQLGRNFRPGNLQQPRPSSNTISPTANQREGIELDNPPQCCNRQDQPAIAGYGQFSQPRWSGDECTVIRNAGCYNAEGREIDRCRRRQDSKTDRQTDRRAVTNSGQIWLGAVSLLLWESGRRL
ncbi:hypothetical protein F4679DRAFT_235187 [Xylaria curta]|nr:hypothetical protein F4679DRAFT_235187 [Xylaria curta]